MPISGLGAGAAADPVASLVTALTTATGNYASPQGAWSSSTTYTVNQVVTYGGSTYRAKTTSANVTPGTDATKWEPWGASAFTSQGNWATSTAYVVGDVVTQSGQRYVCRAAHTSGTFATDLAASKWVSLDMGTAGSARKRPEGSTALKMVPTAVSGGWIFKPQSSNNTYAPVNLAKSAITNTDFALTVAGTEYAVVYPALTPIPDGYRGTATLASTPAVTVDMTLRQLDRGAWRKTVTLTAASATTAKVLQEHQCPLGSTQQKHFGYEQVTGTPTSATAFPMVGYTQSWNAAATFMNAEGFCIAHEDGWVLYPSPASLDRGTNGAGETLGVAFGYGFSGAEALTLPTNTPVTVSLVYFTAQLANLPVNATTTAMDSMRRRAHYVRALSMKDDTTDEFTYTMSALLHGRNARISAADTSGTWLFPSAAYATTCWTRDSFWAMVGLRDADASRQLLTRFAGYISANRAVNYISVSATDGSLTAGLRQLDDANALTLCWALWHYNKFGESVLTTTQRDNLVSGITSNLDGNGYWIASNFSSANNGPIGWCDSLKYGLPTTNTNAVMQGWTYLGLKAGALLGATVNGTVLANTKAAYQAHYQNGWVRTVLDLSTKTDTLNWLDVFSIGPDFWAQYLLGETLLTDNQVASHMNKLFANAAVSLSTGGRAFKVLCNSDGSYLSQSNWTTWVPGSPNSVPKGGDYQNGGSWLLHDFTALAVANLHGYTNNDVHQMWADRVTAEFAVDSTSHEFLGTSTDAIFGVGTCSNTSWGFAWNCGVIGLEPFSKLQR